VAAPVSFPPSSKSIMEVLSLLERPTIVPCGKSRVLPSFSFFRFHCVTASPLPGARARCNPFVRCFSRARFETPKAALFPCTGEASCLRQSGSSTRSFHSDAFGLLSLSPTFFSADTTSSTGRLQPTTSICSSAPLAVFFPTEHCPAVYEQLPPLLRLLATMPLGGFPLAQPPLEAASAPFHCHSPFLLSDQLLLHFPGFAGLLSVR